MYGPGAASHTSMTFEQAVLEVIAGTLGNGQSRIDALNAAGLDPVKVQVEVNKRLTTDTIRTD